jgi:hypothetical protein
MGQSFYPGIKVGGLLTDPAGRFDESRRYVAGPSIEIGLPGGLAAEASLLYGRFGTSLAAASPGIVHGHAFELPVLGKYYFGSKESAVRPFAASGFALRKIWFDYEDRSSARYRQVRAALGESSDLGVGAVVSGGATFKIWRLMLSPELRYTRWGGENFPSTNPNQLQAVLIIGSMDGGGVNELDREEGKVKGGGSKAEDARDTAHAAQAGTMVGGIALEARRRVCRQVRGRHSGDRTNARCRHLSIQPSSALKPHHSPLFGNVHVHNALWRPDPVVLFQPGNFHVAAVAHIDTPFDAREVDAP